MEDPSFQPPLYVSLSEAARLLSVSLRTVQRMVKAKKLKVVYITPDSPRIAYSDLLTLRF